MESEFKITHYLSKYAEKVGYIDDNEFPARNMVHFNIDKNDALRVYYLWKKYYIEALLEKGE